MNWRTRHFLRRRRWDAWLAAIGGAAMPLRHGITPLVAIFYSAVGMYLVAVGHRKSRRLAPWFVGSAVAYLCWSLLLTTLRGDPYLDNRQLSYSLLICTSAFIANGLVLVRDPIRLFVIGSRVGVVATVIASIGFRMLGEFRVGLGGNPAPFAMLAAICMIAAILPVRRAPYWAPNSWIYVLIGSIPIVASETRALLVVIPLIVSVEYAIWLWSKPQSQRIIGAAFGFAITAAIVSVGPVNGLIDRLFMPVMLYYTGQDEQWDGSASGDIRLSLWQGALGAISEKPLTGYGDQAMGAVIRHAPEMQASLVDITHVHNMVLDEGLAHGLPGIALLVFIMSSAIYYILRGTRENALKRNVAYFYLAVLAYGSLHNPFLHETTIFGIFLYIGVMIAGTARTRHLRKSSHPVTVSADR